MNVRNSIGFAIMKVGHKCLDRDMAKIVGLATVIGQSWMNDNRQTVSALMNGEACLMPVPGAMRGSIKEFGGDTESHEQSMGFGTKH